MQWVDRILSRAGFERRAAPDPSWAALQTFGSGGGAVSARLAENLTAVTASVAAIASALASAPVIIYRRTPDGRTEQPAHPLRHLFDEGPNQTQSWPDLAEAWIAGALLHGNGVLEIVHAGGTIEAVRFIPWGNVAWMQAPSGRLVYDVTEQGPAGRQRRLLADDVAHLKDRSDDGLIGRSRLARSAEAVAHGLDLQTRQRAVVANGAAPSGAITSEQPITAEAFARLRQGLEDRHTGAGNAGKVLILSDGLKWQGLGFSPEDAELLASRQFSVEEIARLYAVPPPLIQDYSHNTFTTSAAAGRWFAQFTLMPWARKIEAVLGRALFPAGSGYEIEIDLSGLLRGDPETRWAAHKIAIDAGILDADEVREIEGYNPRGKAGPLG